MSHIGPICLALLLAAPWPVAAAAAEASYRTVRLGSAGDVIQLAERAVQRGDLAAAEMTFRALFEDPDPKVRAEARFRLAKLAAATGRTSEAAVLLRRVLDEHPKAVPARLELAALLSKMGDEKSALRELRAVRTTDLPLNVARFVDRWSASLQASRPFGLHLELALAPDSNVNRATRSDTLGTVLGDFTFTEDAKAKSGVGAAMRGAAYARLGVTGGLDLVVRAVTDVSLYRDKEFNDIFAELSAGPEFVLAGTRFTAELGLSRRWYGMEPYQQQLRLSASATRPLGPVAQGRLDASLRWSDNKVNNLQHGRGLTLVGRYERALTPQLSISGAVTMDRFKASDDAYSTRAWFAGLTAYRDIGRVTLSLGAEIGRLKGDERLAILPEAREDRFSRVSLGAVFRRFTVGGFAPLTRLVVERNRSNIEYHDFKRTRTEFGVTRAF